MRAAEVTLLALVALGALRPITRWSRSTTANAAVTVAQLLAALVHVQAEGARWQLTPLYLAAAITVGHGIVGVARPAGRSVHPTRWWAVFALAGVGAALGWALPVVRLPAPTGPARIGTTVVVLEDPGRAEAYGAHRGRRRELVAQVWYPAAETAPDEPAPWLADGRRFGRAAARGLGLPAFALDHLGLVRSHAVADAAPIGDTATFPVVLYSHGWTGFRAIQSDLAEQLASVGYAVVAVDHTHAAIATVFPDGRIVPQDPRALPADAPPDAYDAAARQLVATFADDLRFVLRALAEGAVPLLRDRLALDTVALIGHSTGGGAAITACVAEPRCRAVVGFDPWVEPVADDTIGAGLDVPLLSLRSEEWEGTANDTRLRRLHAASRGANGLVTVEGSAHRDVTLLPALSPLSGPLGLTGPTASARTRAIVASWTQAFLDAHLRGTAVDPLERPLDLDEARLVG